mmetsp:Transcript_8474/g.14965  ORF Transcript_8474/g.14965 Transcript_8474/m.14965 type:complete len:143 (+) Transcript_8474:197-625(+)
MHNTTQWKARRKISVLLMDVDIHMVWYSTICPPGEKRMEQKDTLNLKRWEPTGRRIVFKVTVDRLTDDRRPSKPCLYCMHQSSKEQDCRKNATSDHPCYVVHKICLGCQINTFHKLYEYHFIRGIKVLLVSLFRCTDGQSKI